MTQRKILVCQKSSSNPFPALFLIPNKNVKYQPKTFKGKDKILGYILKILGRKNLSGPNTEEINCRKAYYGIPRWWLEGGSRKRPSYSEILERHWRHILQAQSLRKGITLTPPHLQPAQRIPTSC
jgi:hypothetical protein